MAKQNVAEQETLGEAMNKTELFFERNGRTMSYVFLGLLVLAALVFGYRSTARRLRATSPSIMRASATCVRAIWRTPPNTWRSSRS